MSHHKLVNAINIVGFYGITQDIEITKLLRYKL
jgi:hypothetical protein